MSGMVPIVSRARTTGQYAHDGHGDDRSGAMPRITRGQRAMRAVLGMQRIDLAALYAAADSA
jgi:hypothetical protein